mmetsp:Transcript_150932/g.485038  ORF Transcript_150932/g.485038 Transcript_150932/m.485038 type:complete len:99 (+) Transcript_150932:263-559(+)
MSEDKGEDVHAKAAEALNSPEKFCSDYHGKQGWKFRVKVTGSCVGSIWGGPIFSDESCLAKSAVHAGIVVAGETRSLREEILGIQKACQGSEAHGITS